MSLEFNLLKAILCCAVKKNHSSHKQELYRTVIDKAFPLETNYF